MFLKRGIVRKTFLFSALLIILVISVSFTILYFAMPQYYLSLRHRKRLFRAAAYGTGRFLIQRSGKDFNTPDYMKGNGVGLFGRMLEENYTSFVDLERKIANFDDGTFVDLLSTVKEYGELGYIPQGVKVRRMLEQSCRMDLRSKRNVIFSNRKIIYPWHSK